MTPSYLGATGGIRIQGPDSDLTPHTDEFARAEYEPVAPLDPRLTSQGEPLALPHRSRLDAPARAPVTYEELVQAIEGHRLVEYMESVDVFQGRDRAKDAKDAFLFLGQSGVPPVEAARVVSALDDESYLGTRYSTRPGAAGFLRMISRRAENPAEAIEAIVRSDITAAQYRDQNRIFELSGLDSKTFELNGHVLRALKDPDVRAQLLAPGFWESLETLAPPERLYRGIETARLGLVGEPRNDGAARLLDAVALFSAEEKIGYRSPEFAELLGSRFDPSSFATLLEELGLPAQPLHPAYLLLEEGSMGADLPARATDTSLLLDMTRSPELRFLAKDRGTLTDSVAARLESPPDRYLDSYVFATSEDPTALDRWSTLDLVRVSMLQAALDDSEFREELGRIVAGDLADKGTEFFGDVVFTAARLRLRPRFPEHLNNDGSMGSSLEDEPSLHWLPFPERLPALHDAWMGYHLHARWPDDGALRASPGDQGVSRRLDQPELIIVADHPGYEAEGHIRVSMVLYRDGVHALIGTRTVPLPADAGILR